VAVLIDPPAWPAHGRLWSHLASDTSYAELHAFAEEAGVPRRAFEGDHYDVPQERYDLLVAAGARPAACRDLLRALQVAGLRLPKRRGERVLATGRGLPGLPPGAQHDLIAGPLPPPDAETTAVFVVVLADSPGGQRLLLTEAELPDRGTPDRAWPAWDLPGGDRDPAEAVPAAARRVLAVSSGVDVPEDQLVPFGHARITLAGPPSPGPPSPGPRAVHRRSHFAYLLARPGPVGVPIGVDRGHRRVRWLDLIGAATVVGGRPWWPLIESLKP
jgi:ADP-ribose pyrophosphatase YjhB (NUDIX family)